MTRVLVAAMTFAAVAGAEAQGRPGGVRGVVYDSVGRAPLAGAVVQLAPVGERMAAQRSVTADAAGRFTLDSLPAGGYVVGFFHPLLDSLGIEPPLRRVDVIEGH